MPTLREIKSRIEAVKKIEKITNALEIVALTRLRKIEAKTEKARDYFNAIRNLTFDISRNLIYEAHPFLKARRMIKKEFFLVATSDKGLCGDFNTNMERELRAVLSDKKDVKISVISLGRKGSIFLKKMGIKTESEYRSSLKNADYVKLGAEIGSYIAEKFLKREIDEASIIYNQFKRQFLGKPRILKILPLKIEGFSVKRVKDYIYEPEPYSVLEALLREYIANQIGQVILESNAAEEIARMLAMKQARDNAEEAIDKLGLSYHKQRQMRITRELIDIATAAEAEKV